MNPLTRRALIWGLTSLGLSTPLAAIVIGGLSVVSASGWYDGPVRIMGPAEFSKYSVEFLPQEYRWLNRDGSCVHCSTYHLLHASGLHAEAIDWEKSFHNGEYAGRHMARMESKGLKFAVCTNGDERFLDWACGNDSKQGANDAGAVRSAGITLYSSHVLNLMNMDPAWVDDPKAYILNNWSGKINQSYAETRSRKDLIREWKSRGGWAFVVLGTSDGRGSPAPPTPYVDPEGPY